MIKRKSTFFLGVFIFLTPFLGFPTFWKTVFVTISGLVLIGLSIKVIIPKKHVRVRNKKEKSAPVSVENIAVIPKENFHEVSEEKLGSNKLSETQQAVK